MIDVILLFAFCLFMGLVALVICAYLAISGQLFTLDGLVLALITLSIGGLFMLNVAWSIRSGELQQMLNHLRKQPTSNEPSTSPS